MQRFDFTETGGFPLTQDRLKWMQDGYISAISAVAGIPGGSDPVALTGAELTSGSWTGSGTISDGWIWHPLHGIIPFVGGAFTASTQGISYQDVTTPLVFENSASKQVQITRMAGIAPGGLGHLRQMSENRWPIAMAASVRKSSWTSIPSSSGPGELNYIVDEITQVAHLNGWKTINVTSPLFANGSAIAFSIPAEIAPKTNVRFLAVVNGYSDTLPIDYTGNIFNADDGEIVVFSPGNAGISLRHRRLQTMGPYNLRFNISYPLF